MQMSEFATKLAADPQLAARLAEDPAGTINTVAATQPLQSDVHIYRWVVIALGLTVIISVTGIIALAFVGKEVPGEAVALGSAAVGALAGLLAPSPRQG